MSSMRPVVSRILLSLLTVMQIVTDEEQRLGICKSAVNQIYSMFSSSPRSWRNYLSLARSVIAHIDNTSFMQQASRTNEQAWMIAAIQRLAFADVDSGAVGDLDAWASRQWLVLLQRDQSNVTALRGLGQVWLSRAQPALSKIHRIDGSSSSGGSGVSCTQLAPPSNTSTEDDRQAEQANAEAERRAGTTDYVEARGFLQPATEYFARAIAAATAQRVLSGDLLSIAAEAFMSLGNASSPRVNVAHFRRAVQLLRAASRIQGYTLPTHQQRYLDDFGRLVD